MTDLINYLGPIPLFNNIPAFNYLEINNNKLTGKLFLILIEFNIVHFETVCDSFI